MPPSSSSPGTGVIGLDNSFVTGRRERAGFPETGAASAHARDGGSLDGLKAWLQQNNTAVMAVLLLVLGVVLLGQDLGGPL